MTATETVEIGRPNRSNASRWVVVGMFAFAIALTGACWVYWRLHVAPFLPLQQLLADEYEDCRPKVRGGQRKMHKATPRILRITMKIDFDPTGESGEAQADGFAKRVASFVADNWPELSVYETLELHLYWPEPEKTIKQVTREYAVPSLLKSRG
ncbi:MAG: hypothetical protein ACE5KM_19110 [Planctomycetaceae bacterium]